MRARRLVLLAVLFASAGAGCGGSSRAPYRAVTDYAAALEAGAWDRAYDLMSEGYRRTHARADYVRMMQANPDDARETARRLRRTATELDLSASVELGPGESVALSAHSGQWRLVDDPSDLYSQRTPRDCLRAFVRAWQRKRWDVMLKLIPDKWLGDMNAKTLQADFEGEHAAERKALMERLLDQLAAPIESIDASHAILRYGDRYQVDFVREQGLWKIGDPD